jgi:peptidoglycan/LPS O-acetylase OafA/YrhL
VSGAVRHATEARKDIRELTGLRGLAALVVVVSHAANQGILPSVFGGGLGQVGVMVFFVLSGFLMGHLYGTRPLTRSGVETYARSRVGRVFPLYLLVLVVSAVASAMALSWHYEIGLVALLSAGFFLVAPQELWSIPVEVQFYAAFIGIWFLAQRPRRAQAGGHRSPRLITRALIAYCALLVVPLVACLLVFHGIGPLGYLVFGYAHVFIAGTLLGLLWENRIAGAAAARRRLVDVGGAVVFVLFVLNLPELRDQLGLAWDGSYWIRTWMDPITLLLAVLLFVCAAARSRSLGFLNSRVMQRVGELSFAIYLFHPLLLSAAVGWAGPGAVGLGVGLGATWLLAEASARYVERPLRDRIRGGHVRNSDTRLVL